jgi:hypothetical protein
MKKIALIACTLLLVGCGTSSPGDSEPSPSRSTPEQTTTTAPAPFSASETRNCRNLTEAEDGLIVRADSFLADFEELNDNTAAEAQAIVNALEDAVNATSSRRQQDLLEVVHENGNPWDIKAGRFREAGEELIASCYPLIIKSEATSEPTRPTTPATPRSTPSGTPSASPQATQTRDNPGATFSYLCKVNGLDGKTFTSFEAAWESDESVDSCRAKKLSGYPSEAQESALMSAFGSDNSGNLITLYALCAQTGGVYIDNPVEESVAKQLIGALSLCPDHPRAQELRASADDGLTATADQKAGKLVGPGSYLVGTQVMSGTWQSRGAKVEDCYWEIADAQGNIIENNFITFAPQFTIYIPPTAASFTAERCSFRWISE